MAEFTVDQLKRIKELSEGYVSVAQYKKILKQVESADELQSISQGYNWDDGFGLLMEMIQHEMCDSGTALEIYWRGQPDYYAGHKYKKDVPKVNAEGFSFLKKIEKMYLANKFMSSDIEYDPSESYNESLWQSVVKYAGVPDNMLIANYGDQKERQSRLKLIREKPDDLEDPETLKFLANNYYSNKKQYQDMLDCGRRLFSLDSDLYRTSYVRVMECVNTAFTDDTANAEEAFTESEKQKFYREYIQLKESDIVALEKEIDELNKNGKEVPKIKYIHIDRYKNDLAMLYVELKNYEAAITIHSQLLDQARSGESPETRELLCLAALSNIYQEIKDFDNAKKYVDEILDGEDELGVFFHHRYKLLHNMGELGEAESLLDKKLERLENDKVAAEQRGNPNRGDYSGIAHILEKYKMDYHGAAAVYQTILDKNLYWNSVDRKELLDGIKLLKQSMPSKIW